MLDYSITLNPKQKCISTAFKWPCGTSKCNHYMGSPASCSCGTTLDTGLEALLSHKMSHEPDTEIQLKSMLTKLLTLDSKIIGSILTKYIFPVIRFFPRIGLPSALSGWENYYYFSLLPDQEIKEEANSEHDLKTWHLILCSDAKCMYSRMCIFQRGLCLERSSLIWFSLWSYLMSLFWELISFLSFYQIP